MLRRDIATPSGVATVDGAGSDAVYDRIGVGYSMVRRPDPRWRAAIRCAIGDARTVLNVGAGSGAYEPEDLAVVAVEPSAQMRSQRFHDTGAYSLGRSNNFIRTRAPVVAIDGRREAIVWRRESFADVSCLAGGDQRGPA